jgi:hypothetical protein
MPIFRPFSLKGGKKAVVCYFLRIMREGSIKKLQEV